MHQCINPNPDPNSTAAWWEESNDMVGHEWSIYTFSRGATCWADRMRTWRRPSNLAFGGSLLADLTLTPTPLHRPFKSHLENHIGVSGNEFVRSGNEFERSGNDLTLTLTLTITLQCINQSSNQCINAPMHQSINASIIEIMSEIIFNPSMHQSIHQCRNASINASMHQSMRSPHAWNLSVWLRILGIPCTGS